MHEGSRAISKARAPAGPEGVREGQWGDQGARAKGSLAACSLQASAAARSPLAKQPLLQPRPVKNNAASCQPFANLAFQPLDTHPDSRPMTRPGAHTYFVFLFLSSLA